MMITTCTHIHIRGNQWIDYKKALLELAFRFLLLGTFQEKKTKRYFQFFIHIFILKLNEQSQNFFEIT